MRNFAGCQPAPASWPMMAEGGRLTMSYGFCPCQPVPFAVWLPSWSYAVRIAQTAAAMSVA